MSHDCNRSRDIPFLRTRSRDAAALFYDAVLGSKAIYRGRFGLVPTRVYLFCASRKITRTAQLFQNPVGLVFDLSTRGAGFVG